MKANPLVWSCRLWYGYIHRKALWHFQVWARGVVREVREGRGSTQLLSDSVWVPDR